MKTNKNKALNAKKTKLSLIISALLFTSTLMVSSNNYAAEKEAHGHEETASAHGQEEKGGHADEDGHGDEEKHADEGGHGDEHADEGGHGNEHADEGGHGNEHADEGGEEESRLKLSKAQQKSAGIVVEALLPHALPVEIEALGEVRLNAYATSQITPRIEAQVVKRLVNLSAKVTKGQGLVVLSSVAMAEAQSELLVSSNNWQLVKKLGKSVVSQSRYLESRIAFQQAQAKVLTYGMTSQQIKRLIKKNTIGQVNGNFTLLSPQDGTVVQDDFVVGQLIEPGKMLFEVTDESVLWVEARVNPTLINDLSKGATARINIAGKWVTGKVVQIHHALDEVTRTLAVRIELPNPDDSIHPGQFITARIQVGSADNQVMSLPTDAVLRSSDGDWQVYIEEAPGEFEAKEIDVVREIPGLMIIEGLAPGTRVVTKGAFFVQSEQAKSGFSVHNH